MFRCCLHLHQGELCVVYLKTSFCCVAIICGKGKGKAVPLQSWSAPECSRKLRFPDFMTTAQNGKVSLTHRPPLPPGNTPGPHLCWRLSRPQGHSYYLWLLE